MSIHDENRELQDILLNAPRRAAYRKSDDRNSTPGYVDEDDFNAGKLVQWTTGDGLRFFPAGHTLNELPPGAYEPAYTPEKGYFMQKVHVKTEGLLQFPETNSERVINEIQKFWDREDLFCDYSLTHKRGIMLWGPPGCHRKGTRVIMADGSLKNVENVVEGDSLMGPDSCPRKVFALCRGRDLMYKITPNKGEPFYVNANHILSLKRSGDVRKVSWIPDVLNIKVSDYLKLSKTTRARLKLYHTGVLYEERLLPLDSYFLGVWLGDGYEDNTAVTTQDREIIACVEHIANQFGLNVNPQQKPDSKAASYYITSGPMRLGVQKEGRNPLRTLLKELGVLQNKRIPYIYSTSSRMQRLQLLAGLIDTDGNYVSKRLKDGRASKGYYEVTQKRHDLACDIQALARSLGMGATINKKYVDGDLYWCVNVFGEIQNIPVRISYKKAPVGTSNKDPLVTGFKIKSVGIENYYGFHLEKDHLYLTSDYVVHHNSGKSCTIQLVMADVIRRGGVAIIFEEPNLYLENVRQFREIQPNTPLVVLMEDIDSILEIHNESEVLNILDGVEKIEKVVYLATTNYPEVLGERIINRPSRFDRRFKMPHPRSASRKLYFEHLLKGKEEKLAGIMDVEKWVKDTRGMSIAHLKELFVSVCILGDDYDETIRVLNSMMEDQPDSKDDREDKAGMGFNRNDSNFD